MGNVPVLTARQVIAILSGWGFSEVRQRGSHMWGYTPAIGKYLRVVTLADGLTMHNAFPDRSYKEGGEP